MQTGVLMNKKVRQVAVNLIILTVTIIFMALITEAILRVFSREPGEKEWVGQDKKFYRYDPLLGWSKIPNMNTIRVSVRGKNRGFYQTNSKGIRGPEYTYDKVNNEYRILILGDSFAEGCAEGCMVEFNELFSEILKTKLNKKSENDKYYEVINTGTAGWSTDQELIFYQHEGKKYNPDLTVLMFYENDITYNNQPKDWGMNYKPLFKLKGGQLTLTNIPVPKPDRFIYTERLESKDISTLKKIRKWLHTNSYLYNLIKDRIKNTYILKKLLISLHLFKAPSKASKDNTDVLPDEWALPPEYRVWERKYNDAVRDSWKTIEALIIRLRDEASSIGSKFLIFYIPFEGSIYPDVWDQIKRNYGLSDAKWTPDLPGLVLEDICKRNNIDFINPTLKFRAKAEELKKDKKRLYDPSSHHWNVYGNELVGEILAEYINMNYLNKK